MSFKSWVSFIHPEDLKYVISILRASHSTRSETSYEHRIICRKGIVKYIRSVSQYQFDNNGIPYGIFGIFHDITDRKKAEVKLQSAIKELEAFIYRVSHDLKSPLASIQGLIEVTKDEIKDEISAQYFTMINDLAQKLDDTLSDLIKSMEIKDTEAFNDEINFDELIQYNLNKFQHVKGYSSLKIDTNNSLSTAYFSSKYLLNSIIQNLIGNAIKFQNFNCEGSFLKINVSRQEEKIILCFEDNGIGVASHMQDKIFDMYFRANGDIQGSGLGLYLVKKAVEKFNGEIMVNSEIGEGITFKIILPIIQPLQE